MTHVAPRDELAIVLHTHMPYVEGFGTWPFGEEWLWEAIATATASPPAVTTRGATTARPELRGLAPDLT